MGTDSGCLIYVVYDGGLCYAMRSEEAGAFPVHVADSTHHEALLAGASYDGKDLNESPLAVPYLCPAWHCEGARKPLYGFELGCCDLGRYSVQAAALVHSRSIVDSIYLHERVAQLVALKHLQSYLRVNLELQSD